MSAYLEPGRLGGFYSVSQHALGERRVVYNLDRSPMYLNTQTDTV